MTIQESLFLSHKMQFSLKNANLDFSAIRVRMTINGVRFVYYLPSTFKIKSIFWDSTTGCAIEDPKRNPALKGNPQRQVALHNINKEIAKTSNAIIRVLENFRLRDVHPTADLIKVELRKELNRGELKIKHVFNDFLTFIDYYISLCKEGTIVNAKVVKLVPGTIRNYLSTKSALKRYCESRHLKLRFESINLGFYSDFIKYLNDAKHSRGRYKPNVIGKFVKNIKVFMRYAYENQYTLNDDYKRREFKVFQENVETVYLTLEELDRLYALKLPKNQEQVRDSFLISCYTSLRYSDIARLEKRHINDRANTITITTQKTNTVVVIPIHRIVKEIFEKYNQEPPKVQCNQAANRMIKKLCQQAGITDTITIVETSGGERHEKSYEKCDLITSHSARRSFATNAYKRGMPTLSIMQITGHKTESSFMRYIRISKEENAETLQTHEFFA